MTINSINSINTLKSFPYFVKSPTMRVEGLKSGIFELNKVKIKIDSKDSLEIIAKKINARKDDTKVEAKVLHFKLGYRLILFSKGKEINIRDYNAVLLDLYKKYLVGTNNKCLIQGVRADNKINDVLINYKYKKPIPLKAISSNHLLSEMNKCILSGPLLVNRTLHNHIEDSLDMVEEPQDPLSDTSKNDTAEIIDIEQHLNVVDCLKNYQAIYAITNKVLPASSSAQNLSALTPHFIHSKKAHVLTPTKGKAEGLARFNKVRNYVYAHTTENERLQHGLKVSKDLIKYKTENELNIEGKKLMQEEKTTLNLYKLYKHLKSKQKD